MSNNTLKELFFCTVLIQDHLNLCCQYHMLHQAPFLCVSWLPDSPKPDFKIVIQINFIFPMKFIKIITCTFIQLSIYFNTYSAKFNLSRAVDTTIKVEMLHCIRQFSKFKMFPLKCLKGSVSNRGNKVQIIIHILNNTVTSTTAYRLQNHRNNNRISVI